MLNHNVAWSGGTFYRAYNVARCLVRRGHSATLLTISAKNRWGIEHEHAEGIEIIHTPDLLTGLGRSGWDLWDTFNRVRFLRDRQWDIIQAWDCRPAVILPALYARRQSRSAGGKLLIDWCDWWGRGGVQAERPGKMGKLIYGPIETYFEEAFRTRADGTTVASQALRERACNLGVPGEPMMLLPGGSDIENIRMMDRHAARREIGLPASDFVVGYRSTLTLREVDLLMEALTLARSRIPNLRFLAGGIIVTSSTMPFHRAADKYWGDWITERGRVPYDQIGLYLAACDVFVLPMFMENISNNARWPSKINDFLAAGRPIVATKVAEIAPLFRHSIGIATDDNPQSLADGVVQIAENPDQAREFGRNARTLAEGDLNWSKLAERLESFYERVLNGRSNGC
jgi:glycosyltransferase involved in cell wall biosynthesis